MTTHTDQVHGPSISFWGGPDDGLEFEAVESTRYLEPPEWHRGYRRGAIGWHGNRESVCFVRYVWREVWNS